MLLKKYSLLSEIKRNGIRLASFSSIQAKQSNLFFASFLLVAFKFFSSFRFSLQFRFRFFVSIQFRSNFLFRFNRSAMCFVIATSQPPVSMFGLLLTRRSAVPRVPPAVADLSAVFSINTGVGVSAVVGSCCCFVVFLPLFY